MIQFSFIWRKKTTPFEQSNEMCRRDAFHVFVLAWDASDVCMFGTAVFHVHLVLNVFKYVF